MKTPQKLVNTLLVLALPISIVMVAITLPIIAIAEIEHGVEILWKMLSLIPIATILTLVGVYTYYDEDDE